MKKMNYWLLVGLGLTLSWMCTSCESKKKSNEPSLTEQKTADESKEYLIQTGKELLNTFRTADQQKDVETVEGIAWKIDHYDWDYSAFENYFDEELDVLFCAPRYMTDVVSGKRSPMASPVYTYSFSQLAAIFEANETTHRFEYKGQPNDDSFIVRMKSKSGTQCEVKCWGEGAVRTHSYTYYTAEKQEDRYTYLPHYIWVGYGEGDYDDHYNSNKGTWEYQYVGQGNGSYLKNTNGCKFEYVGKGHGSYKRNDKDYYYTNEWDYYHQDDLYTYVGTNSGNYERISVSQSQWKYSSWDEYTQQEIYVYDENGNYAKYTSYYTDFEEKPFAGSEERVVKVQLPEKIHCTIKEDNRLIAGFDQEIDLEENSHYNLTGMYSLANISWEQKLEATHTNMKAKVGMKYGNKSLLSATVNIPSYDVSTKRSGETYEEYGERIADRWETLVSDVGELTAEVDIINKVQMKAHVSHIGDFYLAYRDWEETYDAEIGDDMTRQAARALGNLYDKYCTAGIFYNTDVQQAKLVFEPYETGSGEGGNYDIEPLIYFEGDQTTYSYSQYFSERRFGSLIDLTEDVANNYIDLLQLFDVDYIELR